MDKETAKQDLESYCRLLSNNNISRCVMIEKKYGLYGYPPNIVSIALAAAAEGENMYKAIDNMME